MDRSTRHRAYFWMMGTCLALILLAWNVVRLWSTTAAVAMSIVAALIPPVAASDVRRGPVSRPPIRAARRWTSHRRPRR